MLSELHQKIIEEYQNGKSISQLEREYYPKLNYRNIQTILRDNRVSIRGGRSKKTLTQEQIELIYPLYVNNVNTIKELAAMVGMDKTTLTRIIKDFQWERKNHNRVNKRINSNYFSIIDSEEKAYWLGFLFTDGSVDKKPNSNQAGRIRLQLQSKDKHILLALQEALQLDCQIIYDKRENSECCSVEFLDEQIFQDLSKYGIVPNKTYVTTSIPYNLIPSQYLAAYTRGLFDGDGNLYVNHTDVTFGFTAYSKQLVEDFQTIISLLTNKENNNTPFFTSAWHINWRGRRQVKNILDILYNNSTIHLERKYELYKQLLDDLI